MAYNGEAKYVPVWARVLEAAEAWGMPPWEVVRRCTPYWWKRFLVFQEARAVASGAEDGNAQAWEALEREFVDDDRDS